MPTPVEEIKARLDIVDFIGEYIRLTPGGANWKARCPFHHEKSPSFMVSRTKGIWHCFGCSKGGDVFAFIQEMEGMEFGEALRVLAKRANVTLIPRDPHLATQRTKLLDIMKAAVQFTHALLTKDPRAVKARDYLKQRGVTDETIDLFHLGYVPPGWDNLKTHLLGQGITEEDIFLAGLTVKRQPGTGSYDRFRGRILFPIHDLHGNAIGFGGRVFEKTPGEPDTGESGAKYINTPQTLLYDKSSVLFGIDRARQDIRREGVAIVVEGYMDCIASHQAGVRHVVASSGTALTEQQVRFLKRYAPAVILSFDADAAGQEAAKRGVSQALAQELTVRILELPEGKDPDELIQRDVDLWRQAIAGAKPALEYFFDATFRRLDLTKVEDKKAAARELLPFIASAGDPVEQTHYLKRLAETLGVEERLLRERLPRRDDGRPVGRKTEAAPQPPPLERDRNALLSERLLALLVRYPDELPFVAEQLSPQAVAGTGLRQLYTEAIVWYTERQQFDPEEFRVAHAEDTALVEQMDVLTLLAEKDFPEENGLSIRKELSTIIHPLKRHHVHDRLVIVTKTIEQLERAGTKGPDLDAALVEFHTLTDELKELG